MLLRRVLWYLSFVPIPLATEEFGRVRCLKCEETRVVFEFLLDRPETLPRLVGSYSGTIKWLELDASADIRLIGILYPTFVVEADLPLPFLTLLFDCPCGERSRVDSHGVSIWPI